MELDKQLEDMVKEHVQPGMMSFEGLCYLVKGMINSPFTEDSIVVEIGTYHGITAALMGRVLKYLDKNLCVLSIDPFEDYAPNPKNPRGNYGLYKKNIEAFGVKDLCVCLNGFSGKVAGAVSDRVAFLTIDGSHEYEDVIEDILKYTPKVRSGGYIWIDDYAQYVYPGVFNAVNETLKNNSSFELVYKCPTFIMYKKLS